MTVYATGNCILLLYFMYSLYKKIVIIFEWIIGVGSLWHTHTHTHHGYRIISEWYELSLSFHTSKYKNCTVCDYSYCPLGFGLYNTPINLYRVGAYAYAILSAIRFEQIVNIHECINNIIYYILRFCGIIDRQSYNTTLL